MKFIEIILDNSTVTEAKLYSASKKASINPNTGITILQKSAYHVIKDCANIANKYLPVFVFGQYPDPFKALYGKFKRAEIEEFISSTNSNFVHEQLLYIILSMIERQSEGNKDDDQIIKDYIVNEQDPYGEYGSSYESNPPKPIKVSTDNVLDTLCEAFNAV